LIKVLVVDDHPIFRHGLISVLEEVSDFRVVGEATNGVEAVAKTKEYQPEVVTMDIRMPGGGGVESTAAIRQILPQTKVLVLTVSDKDEDLFAAIKAGAKGYLLKSAGLDELVDAIRLVARDEAIVSPTMATKLLDEFQQSDGQKPGKETGKPSPRELEVLKLVAKGGSNKEIAEKLFISETTVKAHLRSILEKLHVKNRAEAVAKATAKGLLSPLIHD
jgi:DNA-binding NarL/FixJ family response regulator